MVCGTGKSEKKMRILAAHAPPHAAGSEKINKIHVTHLYNPKRCAGLGPSRARIGFLRLADKIEGYRFATFYAASMCDNNYLSSLVASLFSWRCLVVSASYFLHAAINFRPPSVTVSTHISAPNVVAFQPRAMSNARMPSLYRQNWSTLSPSHPILSALHLQGFRTRFALAAGRSSFG